MSDRSMRAWGTIFAVAVGAIAAACVATGERIDPARPSRDTFAPVAQMMVHRCGTLDCHGSAFRNLRVYGNEGLRLDGGDRQFVVPTTAAEIDETYLSLVLLEPEVMTTVVNERGQNPERLSLIRKGRGLDHHKGLTVMSAGDDQDRCLTTWLGGSPDAAACVRALALP